MKLLIIYGNSCYRQNFLIYFCTQCKMFEVLRFCLVFLSLCLIIVERRTFICTYVH